MEKKKKEWADSVHKQRHMRSHVTLLDYSVGPEGKLWRFMKLFCVTLYSSNVNSCPDLTASPQSMIVQENIGWPHAQHLTVDSTIRIFGWPPLRSYIYSPIELLLQPCGLQRMVICSRNGYTTSSSFFFWIFHCWRRNSFLFILFSAGSLWGFPYLSSSR